MADEKNPVYARVKAALTPAQGSQLSPDSPFIFLNSDDRVQHEADMRRYENKRKIEAYKREEKAKAEARKVARAARITVEESADVRNEAKTVDIVEADAVEPKPTVKKSEVREIVSFMLHPKITPSFRIALSPEEDSTTGKTADELRLIALIRGNINLTLDRRMKGQLLQLIKTADSASPPTTQPLEGGSGTREAEVSDYERARNALNAFIGNYPELIKNLLNTAKGRSADEVKKMKSIRLDGEIGLKPKPVAQATPKLKRALRWPRGLKRTKSTNYPGTLEAMSAENSVTDRRDQAPAAIVAAKTAIRKRRRANSDSDGEHKAKRRRTQDNVVGIAGVPGTFIADLAQAHKADSTRSKDSSQLNPST